MNDQIGIIIVSIETNQLEWLLTRRSLKKIEQLEQVNSCWYHTNNNHFEFNKRRDLNKERRGEGLSLSVSVVTGAKWECGLTWRITHYSIRLLLKRKLESNGLWKSRNDLWSGRQPVEVIRVDGDASVALLNNKVSVFMTTKRARGWQRDLKNGIETCSLGGEDTFMIWILHLPVSSCQSWTVERLIAAKGSTA